MQEQVAKDRVPWHRYDIKHALKPSSTLYHSQAPGTSMASWDKYTAADPQTLLLHTLHCKKTYTSCPGIYYWQQYTAQNLTSSFQPAALEPAVELRLVHRPKNHQQEFP